jgi:hypothetical protein
VGHESEINKFSLLREILNYLRLQVVCEIDTRSFVSFILNAFY